MILNDKKASIRCYRISTQNCKCNNLKKMYQFMLNNDFKNKFINFKAKVNIIKY
jgi:hypothetical protein